MKTTKRGKLLMLACAALVAVLACLPLLWFRAQDARMFGTVNQSSGLYESRGVSGDDFYLYLTRPSPGRSTIRSSLTACTCRADGCC